MVVTCKCGHTYDRHILSGCRGAVRSKKGSCGCKVKPLWLNPLKIRDYLSKPVRCDVCATDFSTFFKWKRHYCRGLIK